MSSWTPQQGYYELAVSIVEKTAVELRRGSPHERADAAAAVRGGGLERWVAMTTGDEHTYQAVMGELRRLARLGA